MYTFGNECFNYSIYPSKEKAVREGLEEGLKNNWEHVRVRELCECGGYIKTVNEQEIPVNELQLSSQIIGDLISAYFNKEGNGSGRGDTQAVMFACDYMIKHNTSTYPCDFFEKVKKALYETSCLGEW